MAAQPNGKPEDRRLLRRATLLSSFSDGLELAVRRWVACVVCQQPVAVSEHQRLELADGGSGLAGKVQLLLLRAATKHYSFSAAPCHMFFSAAQQ